MILINRMNNWVLSEDKADEIRKNIHHKAYYLSCLVMGVIISNHLEYDRPRSQARYDRYPVELRLSQALNAPAALS